MNGESDTITAIATASGEGGIAIVRLSGPETYAITDAVFECKGPKPSERPANTFVHGRIWDNGELVDEVLLLIMKAPRSYTCEDMVEIQGHGGRISAQRILRLCLKAGARMAEPGEFTKRAFLNGRIDLVQAEAVADLIHAKSERAASAAVEQLEGQLSEKINAVFDHLIQASGDLEASLDFSEEDISQPLLYDVRKKIDKVAIDIKELLKGWDEGHLLRDGAAVVIVGRPNTGKSTLLNALLQSNRAIVSDQPGTTRDSIEESFLLNGIPVRLIDTAGIRDTDCQIELAGITRTHQHIKRADLILFLIDASQPMDDELRDSIFNTDVCMTLIVNNKQDIKMYNHSDELKDYNVVDVSLLDDAYINEIKKRLSHMLEQHITYHDNPHAVISERHRKLIQTAVEEIETASELLGNHEEEDTMLIASHLRDAVDQIGKITGRVYYDELLDTVFSQFCVGK